MNLLIPDASLNRFLLDVHLVFFCLKRILLLLLQPCLTNGVNVIQNLMNYNDQVLELV